MDNNITISVTLPFWLWAKINFREIDNDLDIDDIETIIECIKNGDK